MKNLALRKALVYIFSLMLVGAAFGQRQAELQTANVHVDRGFAKERKGDIDGAMADYNQAIKLNPKLSQAYNNREM